MLHSLDEHKDESLESIVLMTWIKSLNRKRKVQIWEIELMIQQIREDMDLMIRIGREQGWIKEWVG